MNQSNLERLPRFSWADIKKCIEAKEPFEALSPMQSTLIRIKAYEPLMGLAVHAGKQLREELLVKMAMDDDKRSAEEDPLLASLISEFPVQMIALDSRYEYDLDRTPDDAVYLKPFQSWGKKVWQNPPTPDELDISLQKHDEFHELMLFVLSELSDEQNRSVVLNLHSLNCKRTGVNERISSVPLFDLGTSCIKEDRHKTALALVKSELEKMPILNTPPTVGENVLFKGTGAIAKAISSQCPQALVISLRIKKIYEDSLESNGEPAWANDLALSLAQLGQKALGTLVGS